MQPFMLCFINFKVLIALLLNKQTYIETLKVILLIYIVTTSIRDTWYKGKVLEDWPRF